jgi:stage II sporulation protein GA (sporulation sigma-E factor processing peptidase)
VCSRICLHRSSEIVKVKIFVRGRTLEVMALVDTGNTLMDSIGNCPVLVADGSICKEMFKVHVPIDKPVEAMEMLSLMGEKGVRLLPYHAVGVSGGLLLTVKPEKIVVGDREVRDILIAFSPTPVGEGAGYEALIGGEAWDWQSK